MVYLILILGSLGLLAGFLMLVDYEARRGVRVYASQRGKLDETVSRIEFIITHVDVLLFLRDELRHFVSRIGHDAVHLSLLIVRAIERVLTRIVRRLRTAPEIETAPRETAREFVKTLSDFKDTLKATRPEISDIH